MVNKDTSPKLREDLMKYDGVYHKITRHDIECECFCSAGDCAEEFDTVNEIVIETYSNLFHVKCFGDRSNVRKPSFDD